MMKKSIGAGWMLAAAAGLAWLAGAMDARSQQLAPVNPAYARWAKDGDKSPATATRAPRGARRDGDAAALGFVPEVLDTSYLSDLNSSLECGVGAAHASRFDLREQGVVTGVRDQGNHPTCWAFASMGSLEGAAKKSWGGEPDFSENHMANRHGWSHGYEDGGNAMVASGYLLRWAGPVAEADDPYPEPGSTAEATPAAHVQRIRWIPGKVMSLDNDLIKEALEKHGALYASLWWSGSYYDAGHASYYVPSEGKGKAPNHAVTLVGWDDAYPRGNFAVPPPGNGAWIAKNSWGGDWGDGGYFHISYYDATFAWQTLYAFCGVEGAGNYGAVHEHDPLGVVNFVGQSSTAWGANMFSAESAETVAAVGFWAATPGASYRIQVYAGCSADAPRSGRLAADQHGKLDDAGYATVPLETPVELSANERFSVVLQLTTPGYRYPLAVEYCVPGATDAAAASKGESFISLNGQTWSDFMTAVHATANFCCKAYVAAGSAAPARTLAGVSISGVSTISSGASATFRCTAEYSDGATAEVTPAWSIVSGGEWASVDASGTVTAAEVEEPQRATLHADYEEDGIAKGADWTFEVTVAAPQPPTGLEASQGEETTCVRLWWNAVAGASGYAVWRSPTGDPKNAGYVGATTVPRYSDTSAAPGMDYTYFVKAKNATGASAFGTGATGWRALPPPSGVAASDGTDLDAVRVAWEAVETGTGLAFYRVWRAEGAGGDFNAVSDWIAERSFTDSEAVPGVPYRYQVTAALDENGWRASAPGVWDEGWRGEPVTLRSLEISGPAALESGSVGDYASTAIYSDGTRVAAEGASWSVDSGTLTISADGATATLTVPVVAENATATLEATWMDAAGATVAGTRAVAVTPVRPAAPASIETLAETTDGVTLAWSAAAGASGYTLWRGTNENDRGELAFVAETQYADASGEPGTTYRYWVSSANAAGTSAPGEVWAEATRRVAGPSRVTATHGTRAAAVGVSWVPGSGATHHRVWRSDAPDGEKTALCGWIGATSWSDETAEAETEYWYWVESGADAGGKAAGGFGGPAAGLRMAPREAVGLDVAGPDEVSAGTSASYAATVRYSDDTAEPAGVAWSVNGGGDWATIDAAGVLTVDASAADASIAVAASWDDGAGKRLEGSRLVTVRGAAEASASISSVMLHARWPWNGWVDVDYTLETAPEGQTATVSLSGWDLDRREGLAASTLEGDGANGEPVEAGMHRLSWNVGADHPGFHAKEFRVSMGATPWKPAAVREAQYAVVDMSGGASAAVWPVEWLDEPPAGGFNTDEYKTGKLVLRRIEPGTFTMGSPTGELGRWDTENQHEVTLTKPYYIGLFEVSQRQWELATGTRPSFFANDSCYATRPVEKVSYADIRGSVAGAGWPADNDVDAASFLGILREKTGLTLDLPTEAQWEWACRAGTTTALYNGMNLSGSGICTNLEELGRYLYNGGQGGNASSDLSAGTAAAGSYLPNPWGLYDMHGNVTEWCLDWYVEHLTEAATEPVGSASGTYRCAHGGAWNYEARFSRSAARHWRSPSDRVSDYGLRLACAASGKRTQQVTFATIGPQTVDARVELSATATSGGPVTFAVVSGPGVLDGNVLTFEGAGRVVVGATQAGDDTWEAATATQAILVMADSGVSAWLVVDMSGGPSAASWPVEWLDAPPEGGFNADEYKTTKLVLKKIAGGTFTMGSPSGELGRWNIEDQHEVTLTKPYYIGVFQVTQRQWELAMGTRPSFFANSTCYAMRPVEQVSYEDIRGSGAGSGWPTGSDVDEGSFLGVVREKTGLAFDLPTEAQWEWACRAGTTAALYSGKDLTGAGSCPNLAELGRYLYNGGQGGTASSDLSAGTAVVGSYLPNAWGLHDMLGNATEWCLDWLSEHLTSAETDPVGPVAGTYRTAHGGGWDYTARFCRSATRHWRVPSDRLNDYGFRLACPAGGKRVQHVTFETVAPQTVDGRVELSATATSGGTVTFALVSGPGALDGNVLTFTGAGTVTVSATQAGDETWEAATAMLALTVTGSTPGTGRLLHRWSFNGDLTDAVGGSDAVSMGTAGHSWTADGKSVSLPGGSYGSSALLLGRDVVPSDGSPVTIEIWGTQRNANYWGRIFDLTSQMGAGAGASWVFMSWSHGYSLSSDHIRIWEAGPSRDEFYREGSLAPYSLGVEYHISAVFEPNKNGTGQTFVRFAKRDAETGVVLAQVSGYVANSWSPSMLAGRELWLGHSSFECDGDVAADYNEVRIWNTALSDAQLSASASLGPDDVPEIEEEDPEPTPEPRTVQLRHRWSFNGDFEDSIGGQTGVYSGSAACAWRADGKAVSLAGGMHGNSGVCLGRNAVPANDSPVTIEIWGTQREALWQARMFEWTSGMDQSYQASWLIMGWCWQDDVSRDQIVLWRKGGDYLNAGTTASLWTEPALAPYSLGVEYHISAVIEPDKDGDGRTHLRFAKRDAATGVILAQSCDYVRDDWVPSMFAGNEVWLGHSSFPNDRDAAADYDEVRIWSGALTDEQLSQSALLGPDDVPDWGGQGPAPATGSYLVVDLSGGPAAESWPVEELDEAPAGGFNTDEYKTTKLVLRRIEPGTFAMGSPNNEVGRWSNCETLHSVTLTQPYYIAVFEMTQRQWELATGTRPSYFTNQDHWATRPVECVSFEMLRGSNAGERWPLDNAVDDGSFIALLRQKTGLPFDLPTEAQWEYACRAGTTTAINSGKDLTSSWSCPNLAEVARYGHGGTEWNGSSDLSTGSMTVGSYLPNAWGLYDMLGNVWEWCLDWYVADLGTAAVTNPVGPASGTARLYRGAAWYDCAQYCRSAYRFSHGHVPTDADFTLGVRLACSIGTKLPQTVTFDPVAPQTVDGRVALSAFATSGGPVTFALVSGPGILDGNMLTFTAAGTVTVSATQAGNATWESATATLSVTVADSTPATDRLLHRWSFNRNLADSVGGQNAVYSGTADYAWTGDGQAISLSGGTRGSSAISLGVDAMPHDGSPVTVEIWATQREIQYWSRIFELTTLKGGWLMMAWSDRTSAGTDLAEIHESPEYNKRLYLHNVLGGFSTGTEYHVSLVMEPAKDGENTFVRIAKRDAQTGEILARAQGWSTDAWTVDELAGGELWLGRSSYPDDGDASADYNEVRIWNAALSDEQLSFNARLGPDVLPDGEDDPTPPVSGDLAEGLVAWYAFDGDTSDSSGNGHDLAAQGNALNWTSGRNATASAGEASGNLSLRPTSTFAVSNSFTYACWARTSVQASLAELVASSVIIDPIGRNFVLYPMQPKNLLTGYVGCGLKVGTSGVNVFEHGADYRGAVIKYEKNLGEGWHHYAIVVSGNDAPMLYVDGQCVATGTNPSGRPKCIMIGKDYNGQFQILSNGSDFFSGAVQDMGLWNRALTAEEVARLHAGEKPELAVDLSGVRGGGFRVALTGVSE